MDKEPEVKIEPEKLNPAYALVKEHIPEFKDVELKDIKISTYFSMSADIIGFEIEGRKVVYKHKYDYFFDKYFKTWYPQVIKAIKDSNYGSGLLYVSKDGNTLIENYVEGILCKPGVLKGDEQTEFLLSASRELGSFLSSIQSAYDPEFPRNKYDDVLHNGALDLYKQQVADETLLNKYTEAEQKCLKDVIEYLETEEIQGLFKRFNPKDKPFTFTHNDCHYNNILYKKESQKSIIVDFESAGPNCIYYDLTTLILFYCNVYDTKKKHFVFKEIPEYTDKYLRQIFDSFVDNLKLDHIDISKEDRDLQFGIFLETFQLSAMVAVAIAPMLIIHGKNPYIDWSFYSEAGKDMYSYWKERHQSYIEGLNNN